jgi:hypothetical protein
MRVAAVKLHELVLDVVLRRWLGIANVSKLTRHRFIHGLLEGQKPRSQRIVVYPKGAQITRVNHWLIKLIVRTRSSTTSLKIHMQIKSLSSWRDCSSFFQLIVIWNLPSPTVRI